MTDVHQVGPCGVIIHHPMYPPSIPSYHPRHAIIKPENKEDARQHLGFDISPAVSAHNENLYIFFQIGWFCHQFSTKSSGAEMLFFCYFIACV